MSKDKIGEGVTTATVAGALTAMTTGSPEAGAIAAAVAIGQAVIMDAASALFGRKEKQVAVWWERIATELGEASEVVQDDVCQRMADPNVHEVIIRSVRGVLDSVDDSVTPCLAAIAAQYLSSSKPPDRFFRGFVRMVSDLSRDEFEDFCSLVTELLNLENDHANTIIVRHDSHSRPPHLIAYVHRPGTRNDPPSTEFGPLATSARLVRLLKTHELANEAPDLQMGGAYTPMEIDAATLQRLHDLVRPQSVPAVDATL